MFCKLIIFINADLAKETELMSTVLCASVPATSSGKLQGVEPLHDSIDKHWPSQNFAQAKALYLCAKKLFKHLYSSPPHPFRIWRTV